MPEGEQPQQPQQEAQQPVQEAPAETGDSGQTAEQTAAHDTADKLDRELQQDGDDPDAVDDTFRGFAAEDETPTAEARSTTEDGPQTEDSSAQTESADSAQSDTQTTDQTSETPTETIDPQTTDEQTGKTLEQELEEVKNGEAPVAPPEPTAEEMNTEEVQEEFAENNQEQNSNQNEDTNAESDEAESTDAEQEAVKEAEDYMKIGAELQKAGIDPDSAEGQKIFKLIAENPDGLQIVKTTLQTQKELGSEVTEAGAEAQADAVDKQIDEATRDGRITDVKKFSIIKELLLALVDGLKQIPEDQSKYVK